MGMTRYPGNTQQQGPSRVRHNAPWTTQACLLLLLVLLAAGARAAGAGRAMTHSRYLSSLPTPTAVTPSSPPLRVAIYNQLHSHLEVVAGAIHILQHFTTSPITAYVHRRVLSDNLYGFKAWMQPRQGLTLKKCREYDNTTRYDLVWFISPEYDVAEVADRIQQMQPKAWLLMVHNGHMLEEPLQKLIQLAGDQPLFTLSPHVANFTMKRPRVTKQVEWVLPVYPFTPAQPCNSSNAQVCVKGYSTQGRLEPARRNYTALWESLRNHRAAHGAAALQGFKLVAVGSRSPDFKLPEDVADLVDLQVDPPYTTFYELVHHTQALVTLLNDPRYFQSKFSSTVITSLVTGVPILANQTFLDAYNFLGPAATHLQAAGENEVDAMLRVSKAQPAELWRARAAVVAERERLNQRARGIIQQLLQKKGLFPDPLSIAAGGPGGVRHRRPPRTAQFRANL